MLSKILIGIVVIAVLVLGVRTYINKIYFFRDPVRAPKDVSAITAPCDGQVVYIKRVKDGKVVSEKLEEQINISEITKEDFGKEDGWLIGIYMTPLDVHFNYAPIDGTVTRMIKTQAKVNLPMVDLWEYIQVTYLRRVVDIFSAKYRLVNERLTLFIEGDEMNIAMVEIADKFVNKITTYIEPNEDVKMGQKLSFIERGSQVDLVIFRSDIEFLVKVDEQVYGGETPIARIK